jgi:hypothetical protein
MGGTPYPWNRYVQIEGGRKRECRLDVAPVLESKKNLYTDRVTYGDEDVRVALWVIVVIYASAWLSFLAWRWQRQRKLSPSAFS